LSYSDRDQDTTLHQQYYNRVEENLNNAIRLTSEAMNYIVGSEFEPQQGLSFLEIFLTYLLPIGGIIAIVGLVFFIRKLKG